MVPAYGNTLVSYSNDSACIDSSSSILAPLHAATSLCGSHSSMVEPPHAVWMRPMGVGARPSYSERPKYRQVEENASSGTAPYAGSVVLPLRPSPLRTGGASCAAAAMVIHGWSAFIFPFRPVTRTLRPPS